MRLMYLAALVCVGCGSADETAPFANGQQLSYELGMGIDSVVLDVSIRWDGTDHFIVEVASEGRDGETVRNDIRIDRYGRTAKGDLVSIVGHPMWLPPSMREAGAEIVDDGSLRIRRSEKQWQGRHVLVATGAAGLGTVEWYYDKKTGFLVGSHAESMGSSLGLKLVEHNVSGLP